jgi:2-polyprenyl-6-methoxyphenol hydroxylase-like FAD-dependent oxidoreductase
MQGQVPTDIVIVGGGFTGAALACALANGQRRIRVLEARTEPTRRFAGELLHPTGVDELDRLGLLEAVLDAGAALINGFVVFGKPGASATVLPYAAVPGGREHGVGIDHHELVRVLREAARRRPHVSFELGQRVTDLVRVGGRVCGVQTAAGAISSDLVLSAEGRHSRLRQLLGLPTDSELLSFTAAVRLADVKLPHPGYGHIFLGAPGPILAYPISRDHVRVCFDVPVGTRAEEAAARLRASYTPVLPRELRGAVEQELAARRFELVANHRMRARDVTAPGFALVGDAGGCAHPLTAAGMTVCLNDVRIVAEELDRVGHLERFPLRRRAFVHSRQLLTRSLYRVFRGGDPFARWLQGGMLRYWRKPDGRVASTALLTGADPSLRGFARELARVSLAAIGRA